MQIASLNLEKRITEILDFVVKSGERVDIIRDERVVAALIPAHEPPGDIRDHERAETAGTASALESLDPLEAEIAVSSVLRADR